MPLSELSVSTQNYLKEIWRLEEWTKTPATASALAERMGLRISSISDGLKRLAAADLIEHQPYGAIELTEIGRAYALAMIRRHRLIETFLVETLGYTWDRVHDEAEVLEHAVSDFMVDRIDTLLGHPTRDPHGDPIPDSSGHISFPQTVPLSQCEPGETVMLERINDEDPRLLRYLHGHGFVPGARLKVEEGAPLLRGGERERGGCRFRQPARDGRERRGGLREHDYSARCGGDRLPLRIAPRALTPGFAAPPGRCGHHSPACLRR